MSDPQNGKTDTPFTCTKDGRVTFTGEASGTFEADCTADIITQGERCDKTQDWVESQNVEDCE